MKKLFFLLSLLFSSFVAFSEDPIVVYLPCDCTLSPLFFDLSKKESTLDTEYVAQIEKILRFDLSHNGRCYLLNNSSDLTDLIRREKPFERGFWEGRNIPYVVKATLEGNSLSIFAYNVKRESLKGLEKVELSGKLSQDRRKIHSISDSIYEALFGGKGIATTRILYTVNYKTGEQSEGWHSELFESDYDGENRRQLTHDGKLIVTPSYVPPQKGCRPRSYLYVSYLSGQPKIYMGNLKEAEGKRLTFLRGNQFMPVVSPKRNLLAFISDIAGNPELFVQTFDEEKGLIDKPWQVTSFPSGAQGSPTFSPDGKQIAFVSNKDGAARIYVTPVPAPNASAKELKPKLLTKISRENTSPAWSPDGTKLAYSATTAGVRQIWIYDFSKAKEWQLTDGPGNKESPSWAFNSEHLLFHRTTQSGSELYLIHLGEKEALKITSGEGEKRFPSWEP